ncbi:hypothetical protein TanjilG_30482 [Lupinus angustifolius]|uniref:thioredoxin X, chloroplastic n=1 Tax=Lupinus angustifolius TaxID=3871 RepID=UPI00090DED4D|nr:PREDICTED: thioredoxin X, chloroplastic [Lupinus angustifolius]OIV91260.1 hypothetical protein TanjilG_30482 [Lupinus angustifolius]
MDSIISISSSLPPFRTFASSPSTSSSLQCSFFHFSSRTIFTTKTTTKLSFRNNSYALPQFTVRCGSGIVEIDETKFKDTVLEANRPVLVEFVANWCGPCRLISPAIQSLAQEYEDRLAVVKIDHDANPKLIEEYKVYGLPTLILFNNGQEVPESRREGAITKVKLKEYVDALLESISVP